VTETTFNLDRPATSNNQYFITVVHLIHPEQAVDTVIQMLLLEELFPTVEKIGIIKKYIT
jgi:hypothetical protein